MTDIERREVKDFERRTVRWWYAIGSILIFINDLNQGVVGLPSKCLVT